MCLNHPRSIFIHSMSLVNAFNVTVREIGYGEKAKNYRENIVPNKICCLKFCDDFKFSCPSFISYMVLLFVNFSNSSFNFIPLHMDECVD